VSYAADRDYALAVLRRRCGWLDPSDREALVQDAYTVLLEKQRDGLLDLDAMHAQQVRAYVTQTALNKALDEGKRAGRRRSVPLGEADVLADDRGRAEEEYVDDAIDRARLQEILAELPTRQQTIVKLRFFFDRSPSEVEGYLGVTNRVYRRELERAMRSIAEKFELVREGTFCESRRSLILAYVAGIAGPSRVVDARRHLETCPACARWAAELRDATGRVAAGISLPAAQLGHDHHHLVDRVVDVLASAKHNVVNLVTRADVATPQYLAGARPGAVAAAVAGCLAVGGSATYCAVEGLPGPLRATIGGARHERQADKAPAAKPRAPKASRTVVPIRPRRTTTTPANRAAARTSSTAPARRASVKQVAQEFGPETPSGASAASPSAPAAASKSRVPEFGP
jgi:RNA polymerase sigma factor (sigma-70 family)